MSLFQKMIKQRQELAELYDKGGRAELAAQERAEIEIITGLPAAADVGRRGRRERGLCRHKCLHGRDPDTRPTRPSYGFDTRVAGIHARNSDPAALANVTLTRGCRMP